MCQWCSNLSTFWFKFWWNSQSSSMNCWKFNWNGSGQNVWLLSEYTRGKRWLLSKTTLLWIFLHLVLKQQNLWWPHMTARLLIPKCAVRTDELSCLWFLYAYLPKKHWCNLHFHAIYTSSDNQDAHSVASGCYCFFIWFIIYNHTKWNVNAAICSECHSLSKLFYFFYFISYRL